MTAHKCQVVVGLVEMNQALKQTIKWSTSDKEAESIHNKIALNNIKIEKLKGGK